MDAAVIKMKRVILTTLVGIDAIIITFLLGTGFAPDADRATAYGFTLLGATIGSIVGYLLSRVIIEDATR